MPSSKEPLSLANILLLFAIGGVAVFAVGKCTVGGNSTSKETAAAADPSRPADYGTTAAIPNRTLRNPNGSDVVVFLNMKARSDALTLLNVNASPALVLKYVACVVPNGTRAIIVSRGSVAHEMIIDSGPQLGCQGVVSVEQAR